MQRRRWLGARGTFDSFVAMAMLLGRLASHAFGRRRVYTLPERLAMLPRAGLPVAKPVTIHWNPHRVPFIEAQTDQDLAVALGVVHAHLRLGQLELMRRIALGRVSELVGAAGVGVDQLLHTLPGEAPASTPPAATSSRCLTATCHCCPSER